MFLKADQIGKVETIFAFGFSVVKLGTSIYQIVGSNLIFIANIENNDFCFYCGNLMAFN